MQTVILCGICGQFETLTGGVELEQYNLTGGSLTVLACRPCVARLGIVHEQSGATISQAIRALRVVMIEQMDNPAETAVRALRELRQEIDISDRRLRFVVLDGGLNKPGE